MRRTLIAAVLLAACHSSPPRFVDPKCGSTAPSQGCLGDGSGVYTCTDGLYTTSSCDQSSVCVAGACATVVCHPSLFVCDGDVADVCDATGTVDTRTNCATSGRVCKVEPLTADCVAQSCTPHTTFCSSDGASLLKCSNDGQSTTTVQQCAVNLGSVCAGAACLDRRDQLETTDRSTEGCRFVVASLAAGPPTVLIANPQPDLDAAITLTAGADAQDQLLTPGTMNAFAWPATLAPSGSAVVSALVITSSVPVYAWLIEGAGGQAILPEHVLGTQFLVGVAGSGQQLAATATLDGTVVTATVSAATAAGNGVPAATAGGTTQATLARGQALVLSSAGDLTGSTVSATAPIALSVGSASGVAMLPSADELGLDVVVLQPSWIVARAATMVTAGSDGTLMLAAGQGMAVTANQRLRSTAPILVVGQDNTVIAPAEQWRTSAYFAWPSGSAVASLAADGAATLQSPSGAITLVAAAGYGSATVAAPMGLVTSTTPFGGAVSFGAGRIPLAFGLLSLHP